MIAIGVAGANKVELNNIATSPVKAVQIKHNSLTYQVKYNVGEYCMQMYLNFGYLCTEFILI